MGKVKGIFASNISGKVGNVVFRKNSKANVVSQRPANVKNPRTNLQQIQRAYIKTVASAYSVFREICDHSFEGVTYGARSMNFFNKVNYSVVSGAKKAVLKNSNSVVAPVEFVMSKGSIRWNNLPSENAGSFANISQYMTDNKITNIADVTYGQLLEALGLMNGDQITILNVLTTNQEFMSPNGLVSQYSKVMYYARYVLNSAVLTTKAFVKDSGETSDSYKINPAVLAGDSLMNNDSKISVESDGDMVIMSDRSDNATCYAAIISRKSGNKWLRSDASLYNVNVEDTSFNISNVLPSYMPSDEPYLNNAVK